LVHNAIATLGSCQLLLLLLSWERAAEESSGTMDAAVVLAVVCRRYLINIKTVTGS